MSTHVLYEYTCIPTNEVYAGIHRISYDEFNADGSINLKYKGSGYSKTGKRSLDVVRKEYPSDKDWSWKIIKLFGMEIMNAIEEIIYVDKDYVDRLDTLNLTTGGFGGMLRLFGEDNFMYNNSITIEMVVECKLKGMGINETARHLNCGTAVVYSRLKDAGFAIKQRTFNRGEITDEMVKVYADKGMVAEEIAKKLNCSPDTVRRRMKKMGYKFSPRKMGVSIEDIINCKSHGMTHKETAEKLKCSVATIYYKIRNAGLAGNRWVMA